MNECAFDFSICRFTFKNINSFQQIKQSSKSTGDPMGNTCGVCYQLEAIERSDEHE